MKKLSTFVALGALSVGLLAGCGSKPSADELKQLDDLKAEVTSLQKDIANKESEKQALMKAIADKDAQLAQCAKDKDALKARMGGK